MQRRPSPQKPARPPEGPARLKYFRTGEHLPTLAHQQEILRSIEALGEWHDPPPKRKTPALEQRDTMLKGIHEGDEVWIAFPAVWALNEDTTLSGLELLTRHGGVLRIWGSDAAYRFTPDTAPAIELFRLMQKDERERRMMSALQGRLRQREAVQSRDDYIAAWKIAEEMWLNLRVTVKQISEKSGIAPTTLYRAQREGRLPPRNAAPFVGGPRNVKRRGKKR